MLAASAAFSTGSASAAATHVIQPGETLSGIAAANGISTDALAGWNGLSSDYAVISGSSIDVPSAEESAGTAAPVSSESSGTTVTPGSHVVVAGETLSSVAAANGVSIADLAAMNGLGATSMLIEGTSMTIPAGSAAAAAAEPATTTPPTEAVGSANGLGAIWSPYGTVYLDAVAAERWNAMRDYALANYGEDLNPAGLLSGYRTSTQQGDLYELFLSGRGAPANPPGASSHEAGLSVDLETTRMREIVDEIGWQFGWGKLEAPTEWWHVTYGG